jgi:multiple sugar transport system substrate-binding protein
LIAGAVLLASLNGWGGKTEPAQCGRWGDGDTITFATGEDLSVGGHLFEKLVRQWERETGKHVKLVSLPATADGQRSQLVATAQARSPQYDVLGLDVVFTAEFASRGYIEPLDGKFAKKELEGLLPKPLETAKWEHKLWGIPLNTGVGLLFYRTDGEEGAPQSWQDLARMASEIPEPPDNVRGFAGQYGRYEGLTVNVLEAIWGHGGDIPVEGRAKIDAGPAREALHRLREGFETGWIRTEAAYYDETDTLTAFQDGRLRFMRNWPYAYLTLNAPGSGLRDDVGVAPLPTAGALGGQNLAIAACSDDKAAALKFIKSFTSAAYQRRLFETGGYPPTRAVLYREHYNKKAVRHLASVLREALSKARPRPKLPGYIQASEIIQANLHPVILGDRKPDDAIAQLEEDLNNAHLR